MSYQEILSYGYSLVYYMIWLAGIVYAFVNRRKHPSTSLVAGSALGLFLLDSLLRNVASVYLRYRYIGGGLPVIKYQNILDTITFCTFPLSILGWLLLLFAVFRREENLSTQGLVDDHAG